MVPISQAKQQELDDFLCENLASGRICLLKSPVGAPVFFVKKKDSTLRLVQDYRKLNGITIKNSYPLPLISNVLNHLQGSEWFLVLDLCWGFNNIRIKSGDEWKVAFHTNRGLYKPLVMFFRLCNSPATFQGMMNDILCEFINRGVVMCYMDDILVHTSTLEQHCQIMKEILETLHQHCLFLKPEKCKFERKRVEYLGLIISKDHVEMDPAKVQGIQEWHTPRSVKEVRSLGFVNFYRCFIQDFSGIARPLNSLTRKAWKWSWGGPEQVAFEVL